MSKTPSSMVHEWQQQLDALLGNIEAWAESRNWHVHSASTTRSEEGLGAYETRVLTIQSPEGRLIVDPIGRKIAGADGRVDVYAWPSLNRVVLLADHGAWRIRTESGVDWPKKWGRKTFLEIADQLARTSQG